MKKSYLLLSLSIVIISLINSTELFSQDDYITKSKWQLVKLENKSINEIIIPSKYYMVKFYDGNFRYSLEKNTCGGSYKFVETNRIAIRNTGGCTRVCCDGDISDKLVYSGDFDVDIQKDILILRSQKRVYTFKRVSFVDGY